MAKDLLNVFFQIAINLSKKKQFYKYMKEPIAEKSLINVLMLIAVKLLKPEEIYTII
jgi:hypothetical protein